MQAIEVTGAEAMPQAAVAELSGAQGQSIWLLDPAAVVERLKTSAYIEDARASVALPDRLVLQVRERRPEVRWQSGGTRYLLDASGRVLDRDKILPLSDTLVIEDASDRSAPAERPGRPRRAGAWARADACGCRPSLACSRRGSAGASIRILPSPPPIIARLSLGPANPKTLTRSWPCSTCC